VSGYINEQLLPPLPDAGISRRRWVRLHVPGGTPEHPTLITVINIAVGGSRSECNRGESLCPGRDSGKGLGPMPPPDGEG